MSATATCMHARRSNNDGAVLLPGNRATAAPGCAEPYRVPHGSQLEAAQCSGLDAFCPHNFHGPSPSYPLSVRGLQELHSLPLQPAYPHMSDQATSTGSSSISQHSTAQHPKQCYSPCNGHCCSCCFSLRAPPRRLLPRTASPHPLRYCTNKSTIHTPSHNTPINLVWH